MYIYQDAAATVCLGLHRRVDLCRCDGATAVPALRVGARQQQRQTYVWSQAAHLRVVFETHAHVRSTCSCSTLTPGTDETITSQLDKNKLQQLTQHIHII